MKTSVGKTKLEVALGDLTQIEVDAIALATGGDLLMKSAAAAAVERCGGTAIGREAVEQGPVALGQAVATAGHGLAAGAVVHVALYRPGERTDADLIAEATYNALACADRRGARSFALPPLGAGVGGVRVQRCADLMVERVELYLEDHPKTKLRHIIFLAPDDAAKAAFQHALVGMRRV